MMSKTSEFSTKSNQNGLDLPFASGFYVVQNSTVGDSGSPLICEGSLQGLVSGGYYPCSLAYEPVVYTRLCMYRKWISDTMKTNS
ncbi:hypothetical protein QTO34_010072 [Cnephaeus nilssonii]|uniref:Peptidase S1 domain-containing protein n=1 Tax=Cnephaeus nilssonii TaxID=3371016 RepID=A0AA40HEP1_CNENI|nr:hypothetical protein QTO34_010072 [Eptesicus nilssonii]